MTVGLNLLQLRSLTLLELDTFGDCLEATLRQLTALTSLRVALREKSDVFPMYCQVLTQSHVCLKVTAADDSLK